MVLVIETNMQLRMYTWITLCYQTKCSCDGFLGRGGVKSSIVNISEFHSLGTFIFRLGFGKQYNSSGLFGYQGSWWCICGVSRDGAWCCYLDWYKKAGLHSKILPSAGLNCDVKWASVTEYACHVFGVCVVQGMQPAGCWSGKLSAWSLSGVAAQHWSLLSFILHFTPSSHHSLPLYCLPPSFQWTSPPPPPPSPCCCFIAYLLPSLPFFSLSETSSPRLSCPFHFCSFHFLKASFFPIVSFP